MTSQPAPIRTPSMNENRVVNPPASAYFYEAAVAPDEARTLAVLVDNEPGVLARVIGLFSGRGYNIESLTVSETEHDRHISRITIVTRGTPQVLTQIKAQLERMVPVHSVTDMTVRARELGHEKPLERELALCKVRGKGAERLEAMRLAEAFEARVVDATVEHFIFEVTGRSSKVEQFIAVLEPLGLAEVCRTGVAAVNRGPEAMRPRG